MGLPAVDLDDQALLPPEEVGDEGADPDVDLGLGHAMSATERQKPGLELCAGAIGLNPPTEREAKELRLPDCRRELVARQLPPQVLERAGGLRHRDAGSSR